jgi:penicillin-binding protein 2
MQRAMSVSCDVYFYEVARRLGVDKIAAMAKRLGLGAPSGIGLPNEQAGLVPTEAWKKAVRGERWAPGDNLNVGIGQGDVLVTPIQLAVMAARIANGGLIVKPRLVRAVNESADAEVPSLGIPPQHMAAVHAGMYDVINGPAGATTAASNGKLRFKDDPEKKTWTMSGKTGTAAVRRWTDAMRDAQKRDPASIPWAHRDNALFICFGPSHAPRYAISVVVDHALGGGGAFAAPIARDIMEEVLRLDPSRKPRMDEQIVADAAPLPGARP